MHALPTPPPEGWTLDEALRQIIDSSAVNEWMVARFELRDLRKQLAATVRAETDLNLVGDPMNRQLALQSVTLGLRKAALEAAYIPQAETRYWAARRRVFDPFRRLMKDGALVAKGWVEVPRGPRETIHPETWDAFREFDVVTSSVTDETTTYREIRIFAPASDAAEEKRLAPKGASQASPRGRPSNGGDAAQYAEWIVEWWPSGEKPPGVRDKDILRKIQEKAGMPIGGGEPGMSTIAKAKRIAKERVKAARGGGLTPSSDDPQA